MPDYTPSPPPSWPFDVERKLERHTVELEHHSDRLKDHQQRHDGQDAWNKGFTIALAGLGSGLAHAKAPEIVEAVLTLLGALKP